MKLLDLELRLLLLECNSWLEPLLDVNMLERPVREEDV